MAQWTTAFINNLPDAAFAVIESGGEKDSDGKTTPRSLRHLPHHKANVKSPTENSSVDLPHLRNGLARLEQSKLSAALKSKARNHLQAHARELLKSEQGLASFAIDGARVAMRKTPGARLQVLIYDVIGAGEGDGGSARAFREKLDDAGDVEVINVRINSPGGITADGFAIFNALKEHTAKVEVDIDGDASSMASVIAQAGDVRRMADNAEMMIHEARVPAFGLLTQARLKSLAEQVQHTNDRIANVYAEATEQSVEQLREWMAAETYMTAAQAKKRGFVDKVTKAGEETALAWSTVSDIEALLARDQLPLPFDAEEDVDATETPGPVPSKEVNAMDSKSVAQAMGLSDDATESDINNKVTELVALKTTVGSILDAAGTATAEEALGVIAAGKAALAENEGLVARVQALETAQQDAQRAEIIGRIKAAGKCTPAQERDLFPTMDLRALNTFEKCAVPVIGQRPAVTPPVASGEGSSGELTFNGKKWGELRPIDKHDLFHENNELFVAMRDAAKANQAGAR